MEKKPRAGWKDCKIHVFNQKLLTSAQKEAVAPYLGKAIDIAGGGITVLEFLETCRKVGISVS